MTIKLSKAFASNTAVVEFDVRQIKKTLNRLGYYTPDEKFGITGMTDTAVFEALKKFQQDQGLSPTGAAKPGDDTIKALNREAEKTPGGYYIWRTVEDGKVRTAHALFNRKLRAWSDDPDPGEDFNCRCWAEAVSRDEAARVDAIKDVYPEMIVIPLLRTKKIITIAQKLYKFSGQEPRWIVNADRSQLQSKFKHAIDFGIKGTPNNKTLEEFRKALQNHVEAPETIIIKGTYYKEPVTHYFNSKTLINVIRSETGTFKSSWKLTDAQVRYITKFGRLGGTKK